MPLPLWTALHQVRLLFSDPVREVRSEPVDPKAYAFVADVDAALVENILHVSQSQRKSDIHQHAQLDDFRRGFEVAERVLGHFLRLNAWIGRLKPGSPDNTQGSGKFGWPKLVVRALEKRKILN
jgi:hypothetical protein